MSQFCCIIVVDVLWENYLGNLQFSCVNVVNRTSFQCFQCTLRLAYLFKLTSDILYQYPLPLSEASTLLAYAVEKIITQAFCSLFVSSLFAAVDCVEGY